MKNDEIPLNYVVLKTKNDDCFRLHILRAQVQGRKVWSLAPPGQINPEWASKGGCELLGELQEQPTQCTVHPGEAIYLPDNWQHATCNLDALTLSLGGQGDIGDVSELDLIGAILDNDEDKAKALVAATGSWFSANPLLEARTHSGQSAGHIAIMHGRVWALPLLRKAGADLSESLHCNHTDKTKTACLLIAGSPWWTTPGPSGIHPLYLATMYGVLPVVKYLTAQGGSLAVGTLMKISRKFGDTWRHGHVNIAHVACAHNDAEILRWALAEEPSLITLEDPNGKLPLHWCASEANRATLEILVDAGRAAGSGTLAQLTHKDRAGLTAEAILSQSKHGQGAGDESAKRSVAFLRKARKAAKRDEL